MCIRDFVLSDLSSLRQMIHDTIDASYSRVYPERAVEFFKAFHSLERIRERSRKGEILIIERNHVIVATGTIVDNEVLGVFARPQEQGSGYGKAIMNELESRAKAKGFTQITLAVSLPARKFYEDLGYEIIRNCFVDVGESQHLDYWEARKSIASNELLQPIAQKVG